MPTTTIRIDDALKARVTSAAESAGKTPHAFIVEAIMHTVDQAERHADFHRVADERWASILATGKTVTLDEAKSRLTARSGGKRPRKPAR